MTASERIRAARENNKPLVSALDQNPVETREDQPCPHCGSYLSVKDNSNACVDREWCAAYGAGPVYSVKVPS